jgi:hypothetical protein
MYESYLWTVVTNVVLCWITTILVCSRFGLKSLVISWTTEVIWAQVWEFDRFGDCVLDLCSYNLDGSVIASPTSSSTEVHPLRPHAAMEHGAWSSHQFHHYWSELFGTASPWSVLRLGRHGQRALSLCVRPSFLPSCECVAGPRPRAVSWWDVTTGSALVTGEHRRSRSSPSPPWCLACGCVMFAALSSRYGF